MLQGLNIRLLDGQVRVFREGQEPLSNSCRLSHATEREIIEKVLALANMKSWADFPVVWTDLGLNDAAARYDTNSPEYLAMVFSHDEVRDMFRDDFTNYSMARGPLIESLQLIRANLPKARVQLGKTLADDLESVVILTIPEFRGGRITLTPWPYLPTLAAACAYGLALLLDKERPAGEGRTFGERLRQCALGEDEGGVERCEKWFLSYAGEGGGPMPKYCSPEHRIAAALATSGDRVRRHRGKAKQERGS